MNAERDEERSTRRTKIPYLYIRGSVECSTTTMLPSDLVEAASRQTTTKRERLESG